jgi:ABC-type uncharacterized transport system auxiliary subunit
MEIGVAALLLSTFLVAGCATPKYTPTTRYALHPPVKPAEATPTDKTLAVRPLDAARPYGQTIVSREAGDVLVPLNQVEWAEQPRDIVTRALIDALVATHRFADVGSALDMHQPDLMLTGQLRAFDLVRTTKPWKANCEIRLELREALGRGLLYAETLSASEPLGKNDVAALPAAMSAAVSRVIDAAVQGILQK